MNRKVRARTLLVGGLFTVLFLWLVGRMYWVQVVSGAELTGEAEKMWRTEKVLQPKRGTIFDRNHEILANNAKAYTVAVNPNIIHDEGIEQEVVKGLSSLLGKPESDILPLVTKKKEDGSYLTEVQVRKEGWKIDKEMADKVQAFIDDLKTKHDITAKYWHGVYLLDDERRYYPKGSLAAHVLGYVDLEGNPKYGLEKAYNDYLSGTPGDISYDRDLVGNRLPGSKVKLTPAVDGKDLVLTIDQNIQHYMDSALEQAYEKYKPKSITGIAVNPKTMEVLAMTNYPNYNPNTYWDVPTAAVFTNHAISSQYEPGSTFKLVTLTGAVAEGTFKPNDKYQSGSITVPGGVIHDHNYVGWGPITYLEGLLRSSNVAFVKMGYEQLKEPKLTEYINRFNFGKKTGIDMPGEVPGLVQYKRPIEIASTTFGQGGILATPLQIVSAYAAIANQGKMMEPHIVEQIVDPDSGKTVEEHGPKEIGQVVSPEIARQVTDYLEKVVSDPIGTGHRVAIDGVRIAGKSGTAQTVIGGKYDDTGKYLISFVGYAPAEDPDIVIGIFADEPDLGGDYHRGGDVILPPFKEVMSQSLHYMGLNVTPDQQGKEVSDSGEKRIEVPDLNGLTVAQAKKEIAARGIEAEFIGGGPSVVTQLPAPGTQIGPLGRMIITTEAKEALELPELRGKSMRDALAACSVVGAVCEISGEGYVFKQEASLTSDGNRLYRLEFKPGGDWLDAVEPGIPMQEGKPASGKGKKDPKAR